jgi:hypothetical protein
MKRDATALRAITHADDSFAKGDVILGMASGQFDDWEGADMVRAATDAEIAKAKGEKPVPTKRKNAPRKRKGAAPAEQTGSKPVVPAAASEPPVTE